MSDLVRPGHPDFIAEAQRLLAAIQAATSDEDRSHAEHELTVFLRLNGAGRLQEWFDSRKEQE